MTKAHMLSLLLAGVFLPLFPLNLAFNAALVRLRHPVVRFMLLLVGPQIGVLLLASRPGLTQDAIPQWIVSWALLSSGIYALRLLTVRDFSLYAAFLASSALALTWGLVGASVDVAELSLFAFGLSLPVALLSLLAGPLARRFGAAYAGLRPGLGSVLPRLSGILVLTSLAAVATPPFPGFFALLGLLHKLHGSAQFAVLTIWLLWGWAMARLLQGFVFGTYRHAKVADIGSSHTMAYAVTLFVFMAAGLYLVGGGL